MTFDDFDDNESFALEPDEIADPPAVRVPITINPDVADEKIVEQVLGLLHGQNLWECARRLVTVSRTLCNEAGKVPGDALSEQGAAFSDVGIYHMRVLISRVAYFEKASEKGPKPTSCPEWLPRAILQRPEWPELRQVRAMVEWPSVVGEAIVTESGYIEDQRILCRIPERLTTKARKAFDSPVTRERARRAADTLLKPFKDFPFKAPRDRSALLALILTLVSRNGYAGNTPLFVIAKNQKGAGGTMLANTVGVLATGRFPLLVQQTLDPKSEEEEKALYSVVRGGTHFALLDNITRPVGGPTFDSYLTSTTVSRRVMHTLGNQEIPNTTVWCVTGNGIQFCPDTKRRVILIELDSPLASPSSREKLAFPGPKLYAHVRDNRPDLLCCALGLVGGWIQAGRPAPDTSKKMGSFEGWAEMIEGALAWVGYESPIQSAEELADDPEKQLLRKLYDMWPKVSNNGVKRGPASRISAAVLLRRAYSDPDDESLDPLRSDVLEEMVPGADGKRPPSAKSLGRRMLSLSKQVFETPEGDTRLLKMDGGAVGSLWGFDDSNVSWERLKP